MLFQCAHPDPDLLVEACEVLDMPTLTTMSILIALDLLVDVLVNYLRYKIKEDETGHVACMGEM
jgi:hypothetical protein